MARRRGYRKGRKRPPKEGYLGRTAVGRILGCDRGTVTNLEERGELVPTLVDADGCRWYALEVVVAFAVGWKKRGELASKAKKKTKARKPAAAAPNSPDYDPDPIRRGDTKSSGPIVQRVPAVSPTAVSAAPSAPEKLYDPVPRAVTTTLDAPDPPPPTAPKKVVQSNWFSDDFKADDELAPPPVPQNLRGPTPLKKSFAFIDPAWFSDDFQPSPPSER